MARFIENNIICQFGVPQVIIIDNCSHFERKLWRIIELYNIEYHKFSPYRPQTNEAVEAANKNIKNILAKMVVTYKNWAEKLPFALWGYRTSICASIGATPYSLVYRSEVASYWNGDTIFESVGGGQGPRRGLVETKIWTVSLDRCEENGGSISCTGLPKKDC